MSSSFYTGKAGSGPTGSAVRQRAFLDRLTDRAVGSMRKAGFFVTATTASLRRFSRESPSRRPLARGLQCTVSAAFLREGAGDDDEVVDAGAAFRVVALLLARFGDSSGNGRRARRGGAAAGSRAVGAVGRAHRPVPGRVGCADPRRRHVPDRN